MIFASIKKIFSLCNDPKNPTSGVIFNFYLMVNLQNAIYVQVLCRGLSTSRLQRHLTAKHSITTGKKSQDINIIPSAKRLKSVNQPLGEKESIEELVAKLVACDGFSINGITNSSFIRSSFALR